jgi:hypothetical protein
LCCLVFSWILIIPLVSSSPSCNDSSWLYIAYTNVPTPVPKPVISHADERTWKCGHLWHRSCVTVNQIMIATVKLSNTIHVRYYFPYLSILCRCSDIRLIYCLSAEQELLTLSEFTPVLCFVDCCSFVFLFSPLCCLVFSWILITPLVSSSSSCNDSSWLYIAYKNVPYFNVSVLSFTFGFQIFYYWADDSLGD